MGFWAQEDVKKLFRQLGYLGSVFLIISTLLVYNMGEVSFGTVFGGALVMTLLFYPAVFLSSWIKMPPKTLFVNGFVHILAVPTIVYFILLTLFLMQYLAAAFSLESLAYTLFSLILSVYLVTTYVRFMRREA